MSEIDYVYYNFLLYNDTNTNKLADFNETREDSIIKNASDWDMAVVRFSIPSTTIPIFVWKENLYFIGIQGAWGNNMIIRPVTLQLRNERVPAGSQNENYVFNYQLWIDNINYAITELYNQNNPQGVQPFQPAGAGRQPIAYYNDEDDFGITFPENNGANPWFPNVDATAAID